ncbi:hypothetical protein BC937DRAFT_86921, partial [Endogone sp. FLAS-F59071]
MVCGLATIIHEAAAQVVESSMQNISLTEPLSKAIAENLIYWSDALENYLCQIYERSDVVDIFWGRIFTPNDLLPWSIYVIVRRGCYPHSQRMILDGQMIYIKSEQSFHLAYPFQPKSRPQMSIPLELRNAFDKALDDELSIETCKKHYNLVAISTGYKITGGKITDIPAIILHVKKKGIQHRGCPGLFPKIIRGFATDVQESVVATSCVSSGADLCQEYQSEIKLGCSIGLGINNYTSDNLDTWQQFNPYTTCGSLSAFACDTVNNDHGILLCQHVLQFAETNTNGDLLIYQPADSDYLTPSVKKFLKKKHTQEDKKGQDRIKASITCLLNENGDTRIATYIRGVWRNVMVD